VRGEEKERWGWGLVRGAKLITKGWGEKEKFTALKVTRQYPIVLLVKVHW